MTNETLNLFYQEPDPDRWFPYDRFPRRIIRNLFRGPQRPGGQTMVFLNLCKGLDQLGIKYRVNDFKHARNHPAELVGIIGKPNVLFDHRWNNPILFGAAVFSHPTDAPGLLSDYPNIKKIVVPGPWIKDKFSRYYGEKVDAWPVGIDTEKWSPGTDIKTHDFLIYDKVRWEHDRYQRELIDPLIRYLDMKNFSYQVIRYGYYEPEDLFAKAQASKYIIFLCEHETQGLAYQQLLSMNIPILAWDRQGYWQDPSYYPHKVQFKPVSSVPYWNDQCGHKFASMDTFKESLDVFLERANDNHFEPRQYILDHLTLEKCAQRYVDIYHQCQIAT